MALFSSSMVSSAVKKAAEIKAIPVKPTPYPIQITPYPACCGSRILSGFPTAKGAEARLELFLNNNAKAFPGYQMHATLKAGAQKNHYGPVLKKAGYIEVAAFNNPNSGHNLYTYVYPGRSVV